MPSMVWSEWCWEGAGGGRGRTQQWGGSRQRWVCNYNELEVDGVGAIVSWPQSSGHWVVGRVGAQLQGGVLRRCVAGTMVAVCVANLGGRVEG